MELSIVIVNYFTGGMIVDCLHSVSRYNPLLKCELIVVNNSAGTADRELILSAFPEVNWVEMNYNAGFARANNAGILAASSSLILLLNPDTLSIDDSLTRCINMFGPSGYLACGVQLLNPDRTPQISGNFFMKGGLNHLLPLPYWGSFLRWIAFSMKTKIPNVPLAREIEEVDWISGAFLMVKKETIPLAGLMDEDFFLYAEEVEWCSRIRRRGKLVVFGGLHFIHLQGEAINKDQQSTEKGYAGLFDKKALQLMVSNLVRVRKQFGKGWFLFLLLNYTWAIPVYAIVGFFHRLFTFRNPFGEFPRVVDFGRNVFSIWKLTPVILRNQPHFYKML